MSARRLTMRSLLPSRVMRYVLTGRTMRSHLPGGIVGSNLARRGMFSGNSRRTFRGAGRAGASPAPVTAANRTR